MEVILLEKIRKLGNLGAQVKVKPGFARNFLLPYGHAVIANEKNKAEFEARRAELEKTQTDALESAKARAAALQDVKIQIASRASEEGKLFGSVGARELAEALHEAGHEVARSEIQLPNGPLKEQGDFEIGLSLHAEITVNIGVSIVAES